MLKPTSTDLISLSVKFESKLGNHLSDMNSYWLDKRAGGGGIEGKVVGFWTCQWEILATELYCSVIILCNFMYWLHQTIFIHKMYK